MIGVEGEIVQGKTEVGGLRNITKDLLVPPDVVVIVQTVIMKLIEGWRQGDVKDLQDLEDQIHQIEEGQVIVLLPPESTTEERIVEKIIEESVMTVLWREESLGGGEVLIFLKGEGIQ